MTARNLSSCRLSWHSRNWWTYSVNECYHNYYLQQRPEGEIKDGLAARKIQKADWEKLRRDQLNEHFLMLGNVLDPGRPKNDKATNHPS